MTIFKAGDLVCPVNEIEKETILSQFRYTTNRDKPFPWVVCGVRGDLLSFSTSYLRSPEVSFLRAIYATRVKLVVDLSKPLEDYL